MRFVTVTVHIITAGFSFIGTDQKDANFSLLSVGLIQLRNELCQGLLLGVTKAGEDYLVDKLPEPISQARICNNCPHLITCSLHQQ